MLVRRRDPDDDGSAMVSVVVMMLVLTLFAMTLAALVANTGSGLAAGRSTARARAAADAGVVAALAAFQRAKTCPGTVSSATAPLYTVSCTTNAGAVTLTSTGSSPDGRQVRVQAVYSYTTAQSYEAAVGQLTFFSSTGTLPPNVVRSSTSDPAKVLVIGGSFTCNSSMAANVVVDGDFSAAYGCAVAGWVKTNGSATLFGGSSVGKDVTAAGSVALNSVSSVGGGVVAGGSVTLYGGSTVTKDVISGGRLSLSSGSVVGGNATCSGYADLNGSARVAGDLQAGGYADLETNAAVGGNLTSVDYADVEGTVTGSLVAGGPVVTGDSSSIGGSVTAAGTDRTWIHGSVGQGVVAAGPVTVHYNSVVGGDLVAVASGTTSVYGTVRGDLTVGGAVYVDYGGSVNGDASAAGSDGTTIYGKVLGTLKAGGTVFLNYGAVVSGAATAAGTGNTSVYGRFGSSLKVAGTVSIDYSGSVGGDVSSSGSGTDNIYGTISGGLAAGGNVYFPAGRIGGNVTQPPSRSLTPGDAKSRVGGNVTSKAAPTPPGPPAAPAPALRVPQISVAEPQAPTLPSWQDYGYSSADWPGYTPQALARSSTWCAARNWATYLGTFTSPTILDATACSGGFSSHPTSATTVTISTDVVVVASELDLQFVTFKAATGTSPRLWFVVPSASHSVKPYPGVMPGSGDINLDSTTMTLPTMLYTPGGITYHASTFTGSMYATRITLDFTSPGDITADALPFPVALGDAAPSTGPSGVFSVSRISQRELG